VAAPGSANEEACPLRSSVVSSRSLAGTKSCLLKMGKILNKLLTLEINITFNPTELGIIYIFFNIIRVVVSGICL
jgi:hypothetical protein